MLLLSNIKNASVYVLASPNLLYFSWAILTISSMNSNRINSLSGFSSWLEISTLTAIKNLFILFTVTFLSIHAVLAAYTEKS